MTPESDVDRRRFLTSTALAAGAAGAALAPASPARADRLTRSRRSTVAFDGATGAAIPHDLHVLSRISFGPRADELERLRGMGLDAYVNEQLRPETIDDGELEELLAANLPTLAFDAPALVRLDDRPRVAGELKAAALVRAVLSRRQLFEVMVDFWSNHFNIYHFDGHCALLKTVDDREVIRRHALGSFRDLLGASARSPAMLVYLDNHTNRAAGPNENYARELMELHTLGVDGGYTHADIDEVARCFTGRSVDRRVRPGTYRFYPQFHDYGAKEVLGVEIPARGGQADGEQVLDLLASHPSTARHVAEKLCRRFLADEPPESAVESAAATFSATDGDLREVVRTILTGPEMAETAGAKRKRPFELLVSALRALDAPLGAGAVRPLVVALRRLGQSPFDWPTPDGYPDTADDWATVGGTLGGWNLGLALAASRIPEAEPDFDDLVDSTGAETPEELADALAERILLRTPDALTRQVLVEAAAAGGRPDRPLPHATLVRRARMVTGLLLDSPTFRVR